MTHPDAKAPRHLRADTRRWWLSVLDTYQLEDHDVRLLTLACEAWDRAAEARTLITAEGIVTTTARGGSRLHPAVRLEIDSRLSFARLLRELDLDVSPPAEARRVPSLRSIAR